MVIQDISRGAGKYAIVYTDPPWEQAKGGKKAVRPNSSGKPLDYHTMPLADIEEFHERFLQDHTEEKHNVFMWCIDKYLPAAEEFMARLGYYLGQTERACTRFHG